MTGVVKVKARRKPAVAVNLAKRATMACNRKADAIARYVALHAVLAAGPDSKGAVAK